MAEVNVSIEPVIPVEVQEEEIEWELLLLQVRDSLSRVVLLAESAQAESSRMVSMLTTLVESQQLTITRLTEQVAVTGAAAVSSTLNLLAQPEVIPEAEAPPEEPANVAVVLPEAEMQRPPEPEVKAPRRRTL